MPIYAYECADCGLNFERRQNFSDEPLTVCPECGGHVRRLIQPAGIIFKGSGFYINDSKSSKSSLTGSSRSEGKSETGSSSSSSSSKDE